MPIGTVPEPRQVNSADEVYGHQVLSGLSEEFKLDQNDVHVRRVRDIVDKLTEAAHAASSPWHVYVFDDPTFKNAAATKGNYIFVWSGILDAVQSDDELATILAHELGHVLANHTEPEPQEEIGNILSGTAGQIAKEIAYQQGGGWGLAAGLAEMVVSEGIKAALVNPESRRKELEADQIGFFLMSDAGYNPEDALNFWKRAETDPEFSGMPIQFLSSHPSSADRYNELLKYLPEASARYEAARQPAAKKGRAGKGIFSGGQQHGNANISGPAAVPQRSQWFVSSEWATIYESPNKQSAEVIDLPKNASITAEEEDKSWLRVVKPVKGFVVRRDFLRAW